MKRSIDISWKDFLAGIAGYAVSGLSTAGLYMVIGVLARKLGDETLWSRYEMLIALGTFSCFFAGGIILGLIRPRVAVRNASVVFLGIICMGFWNMNGEVAPVTAGSILTTLQTVGLVGLQIAGLILGAWLVQHVFIKLISSRVGAKQLARENA